MRLVIVDDDVLVRNSLKTIIEAGGNVKVEALGSSGKEGEELYKQYKPDIILLDIRMNNETGIECAENILKEYKAANVLFLTTFSDDEYIMKALEIGAKGYILKQDYEKIMPALEAVMQGHNVFGDEIVLKIPHLLKRGHNATDEKYKMTEREKDIIKLIAKGMSNKEIAEKLYLSEGTVRNYISNIFIKLNVRDRTQLVIFYFNNMA